MMKRKLTIALVTLTLSGILVSGVVAANYDTVSAAINPSYSVSVDGNTQTFFNAAGQPVYPLTYRDTNYLPVRAIGELMKKNVTWDAQTQTISLTSPRTASAIHGTASAKPASQSVSAQLRYDLTIKVDGVKRTFQDAQGKTVYPLLYNGSTYLPVRAIGELMGKSVSWNNGTQTIMLTASKSDANVTDVDQVTGATQKPSTTKPSTPSTTAGNGITAAQAQSIALTHAKTNAASASRLKVKTDHENGVAVYEVEFHVGTTEYDYTIRISDGAILDWDHDRDNDHD